MRATFSVLHIRLKKKKKIQITHIHRQQDLNQSKISNNIDMGMDLMHQRFHQTLKNTHTHARAHICEY